MLAVKLVRVVTPSSKDNPLQKDTSKSLTSNESLSLFFLLAKSS